MKKVTGRNLIRILPLIYIFSMFSLLSLFSNALLACTDFRILAKDNTLIIARSLEFSDNLNSNLKTVLRGSSFTSVTPGGKPGMTWQAKYGYIYVDAMNTTLTLDGMNEKGLSFEYLFLPGETQYQTIPADKTNQAIPYYLFGDWILGNFGTVDEVRSALPKILVFAQRISSIGNKIFPLHASITDILGNSIVVEFMDGKMNVYDNKLGVITNSPSFDWHLVDLRNFMDLSPYAPNPIVTEGLTFISATQSAGMIGIPGDYSSPSRFVKTAIQLATAIPAENAVQAVSIAQHILNTVDLTKGIVRAKLPDGTDLLEWSQWAVLKDITNKVLYYRTYDDLTLRAITLNSLDFSEKGSALKMPMSGGPSSIMDVTTQFSAAKAGPPTAVVVPANSEKGAAAHGGSESQVMTPAPAAIPVTVTPVPASVIVPANAPAPVPASEPAATPAPAVIEVVPAAPVVTAPAVVAPAPVPIVVVPGPETP